MRLAEEVAFPCEVEAHHFIKRATSAGQGGGGEIARHEVRGSSLISQICIPRNIEGDLKFCPSAGGGAIAAPIHVLQSKGGVPRI